MLLAEHQSTVNANMPLRLFMYLAEIYRQYVDEDAVYKKESIALPAPKFYVFYNGSRKCLTVGNITSAMLSVGAKAI